MATANSVVPNMNTRVGKWKGEDEDSLVLVTWTNLNAVNWLGEKVQLPMHSDRTIQFSGTFNAATIVLEGSNDGSTWKTLTDAGGSAVSATVSALKQVTEAPLFVRPNANTNMGVATELVATLLLRRNGRLTR